MTNLTPAAATFGDKASEVWEKAEELMRGADKKLNETHNETVDGLHAAASSVRSAGRRGSEAIDNLATGTADKLDATASFVENHDPRDVLIGWRRAIGQHPARAIVVATTIGLLAGCAIRYFTHSCVKEA